MYVITNMTDEDLIIDGVSIPPKQQLDVQTLTQDMVNAGTEDSDGNVKLRIKSASETLEERRADIKAMGNLDLI